MRYLWLVWLSLVAGCGSADLCANTELRRLSSPDGRLDAVLFERNCGATTGFSSQVSVLPARAVLNPLFGNALVVDDNEGAAPVADWGGPDVEMRWDGVRTLRLRHHSAARVFHATDQVEGATVIRDTWPHVTP